MDIEDLSVKIKQEKDIFEKSKLITEAISKNGLKISELSKKISIKPAYICHLIRLQKLPEIIIDGYYSKMISPSHLLVISRLNDREKMVNIYEKILTENLSVAATNDLVRESLYHIKSKGKYIPEEEVKEFIIQLKNKGALTKIIQTRIKGKLVIEFKGSLEFTSQKLRDLMRKIHS